MGSCHSSSSGAQRRVLMLGLDSSGKTAILYRLRLGELVETIPTIGFNVETISVSNGATFTVWDVGGQSRIRPLWRHYYQNTEGLFYVVDSSDKERMNDAKDELYKILDESEMRNVPVIIIANKQDVPNALSPSQVAEALQLDKITGNQWYIEGACAKTGKGLNESLKKMASLMNRRKK